MKIRNLFVTSILSSTLLLTVSACSQKADTMTSNNASTITHPDGENIESGYDIRYTAADFVGDINYARIALAKDNGDLAEKNILAARDMMAQMKYITIDTHVIEGIESGRVVYSYDTDYRYHYFPIETGAMEIKKMSHGPLWAKADLAVTDADVVYLTVDLSNNTAERLDAAEADIKAEHLKEADIQLAKLTDEVVTVDESTSDPLTKARDNILLTRNFVTAGNYTGARYALKHADAALDEMQKDDTYEIQRTQIVKMRREVRHLQHIISKDDPTMAHKALVKLDTWWAELKGWSKSE